jgi:hypothetical protein
MSEITDVDEMHTLIVIGDSLTQARPWAGIHLPHIYSSRLQRAMGGRLAVVNFGIGSNNSAKEVRLLETHLRHAEASYVVVQLGIVDCAPRLMSSLEHLILGAMSRVPPLRIFKRLYIAFKSRHRRTITRLFPKVQVPREAFGKNLRRVVEYALGENPLRRLFLVNIAYPGDILQQKSYGILANVEAYNSSIATIVGEHPGRLALVDVFAFTKANPKYIDLEDGYHILPEAHEFIAHVIASTIVHDP